MCITIAFGPVSQNDDAVFPSKINSALAARDECRSCRVASGTKQRKTRGWRWIPALAIVLLPVEALMAQSFGSHAVGSASTRTITINARAEGTVSNVAVLTLGAPGLDFTSAGSGTCASADLSITPICTQSVTFTPAYPGLRLGAVVLLDSGNRVLGTAYLSGTGVAGLAVLTPGNILPVAGSGGWDLVNDNRLATEANLNLPSSVALDGTGNLYIADSVHNRIRKVDSTTKIITTIAGTGNAGYSGDGGPAVNSNLNTPAGVALDGAGNLYIADKGNNAVRMVSSATGILSTIAGTGSPGSAGDNGPATSASLNQPWGVTVDVAGNLYIADTGNHRIRKVEMVSGIITTVAGNGYLDPSGSGAGGFAGDNGAATSAELNRPFAVAFDAAGNMYIPDSSNNRVRVVNPSGVITTFAGDGIAGYSGDGGPATAARMWSPSGIVVDAAQNVYISEMQNNAIRKVSSSTGKVSTLALTTLGKNFYDGALSTVDIYGPVGLAMDGNGNLYVADYFDMRIREIQSNVSVLDYTSTPTRQGDTTAPQIQTLENEGNAALTLSTITPDTNAAVDPASTTCTSGVPIAVGSTCDIGAEFAPTIADSLLVGNISIAGQTVNAPLDIELVGNATPVNSTSVTVISSMNPSRFGQTVIFSANVITGSGTGDLTGTVAFFDGTNKLQATAVESGWATFSTPALTVGSHSISAVYSGDPLHLASTSASIVQTVNEVTATSISSNVNPIAVGSAVTFTATVLISGGGGVAPKGTVTFNDGATVLNQAAINGSGVATYTTSLLSNGMHSITAAYEGDAATNVLASTSPVLNQDVQSSSDIVLTSTPNPSNYGADVTFTATLKSNGTMAPGGDVKFFDGGVQLGTSSLIGTTGGATFTVSSLSAGSHIVTAVFEGNSNDGPATSPPMIQVVKLTQTSTSLVGAPSPGIAGKPIDLTAKVNGVGSSATFTGTVTFTDGTAILGSVKLAASGIASLSTILAPGAHALVASYGGDTNNVASASAPLPLEVNLASTSVLLKTSASPAPVLSTITFTAIVTGNGGTPTGSVTFLVDGATAAASQLDTTGGASFSDSGLTVGTHTISATYSGDSNDGISTSIPLSQAVRPIPTTTNLRGSSTTGTNPELILVATTVSNTGPIPTGLVTFMNGTTAIGSATLDAAGVSTLTPHLPPGFYNFVASYGGDAVHSASSSAAVSLSATPVDFDISVDPPQVTVPTSQHTVVTIQIRSNNGYSDTIGMGCGSLPASVNCHFSSSSVSLQAGATQSVQVTIDTNNPLSGGQSSMNSDPGRLGFSLAGLCLPVSVLFGCIFWRFRRQRVLLFCAAIAILLSGPFLITGCGGFTQRTAAPGTYVIQISGVGANSNISHFQNVTLVITK